MWKNGISRRRVPVAAKIALATTVAIMAAYFVMEIYWAGTQGLAFSTSNIFMVIFIPVLLVSSSFFVQMLMAAYCPKNRRE